MGALRFCSCDLKKINSGFECQTAKFNVIARESGHDRGEDMSQPAQPT
jgi:hypothetical protein